MFLYNSKLNLVDDIKSVFVYLLLLLVAQDQNQFVGPSRAREVAQNSADL